MLILGYKNILPLSRRKRLERKPNLVIFKTVLGVMLVKAKKYLLFPKSCFGKTIKLSSRNKTEMSKPFHSSWIYPQCFYFLCSEFWYCTLSLKLCVAFGWVQSQGKRFFAGLSESEVILLVCWGKLGLSCSMEFSHLQISVFLCPTGKNLQYKFVFWLSKNDFEKAVFILLSKVSLAYNCSLFSFYINLYVSKIIL